MANHVVIIGNGIAGITAARHIRKLSESTITVISSETKYFYSRTALMYVFMGHMKFEHIKPYEDSFWKKNRINLIQDVVERIEFSTRQLFLGDGETIQYDSLIIATGSVSTKLNIPGQNLQDVYSLYSYQDMQRLDEAVHSKKKALIVGGGLIGIELAEMLHSRNIQVEFLIREKSYWGNILPEEESLMIGKHIEKFGVSLHVEEEAKSVNSNSDNQVVSISTNKGNEYACDLVCVAVGVEPNIEFLRNSELEIDKGILVDPFLKTNIPGVYALGDCAQLRNPDPGRKSTEPVWYTGKMMGEVAANTICGNEMEYHPGNWFNSAKFFNIEFQVYGHVPTKLDANLDWFVWQKPEHELSLRCVWEKDSNALVGVLALGMRISHPVIDQWINEKKGIREVIMELSQANFTPEFANRNEDDIEKEFRRKHPDLFNSNVTIQ